MHHSREIQNHDMGDLPEQAAQNHDMADSPEPSVPLVERGVRTTSRTKKGTSTTVRRRKSSDEPKVSIKVDGEREIAGPKRERSKNKIASQHGGRRSSMSAVDEPIISTKTAGDEPKRERSKSKRASQHRGRRSSMSAVDEPKRERSKSKTASQRRGRRSLVSGVGGPSVKTETDGDGDGTKKERSKSKISMQHRGRLSSMSAVIDNTLECSGFLMGGLVGGRSDLVREKKSTTPFSRNASSRKLSTEASSKHRSGSPDKHRSSCVSKHRSGSPSKQHSAFRSSKQDSSSSRIQSKQPSDSLDNQLASSRDVSLSKRGSQSPRSTRTAQTQSTSSSKSQVTHSESLTPRSPRKKSQDSIKLLVASIDINFADDFKIGESSASTAVKKSEKARQTRLASVDLLESPRAKHQAHRLPAVKPMGRALKEHVKRVVLHH
jgi:hypothetical protein